MQHNGFMFHADAVVAGAEQCRICATSAASSLVDAYGTAICDGCLRRINADPREKRRFMFSMSDAAYW